MFDFIGTKFHKIVVLAKFREILAVKFAKFREIKQYFRQISYFAKFLNVFRDHPSGQSVHFCDERYQNEYPILMKSMESEITVSRIPD